MFFCVHGLLSYSAHALLPVYQAKLHSYGKKKVHLAKLLNKTICFLTESCYKLNIALKKNNNTCLILHTIVAQL